jgi:hypothetical protein
MPQFGGKNAKKTSSDSKRHFTVVMGNKEYGLYVSSTPSSAARKAVTKLCAANKGKKVEFHIREITQGSKKKTYGPYKGYIEKLKEPIELKGRVIQYKPVAKLSDKISKKMRGGEEKNQEYTFDDLTGVSNQPLTRNYYNKKIAELEEKKSILEKNFQNKEKVSEQSKQILENKQKEVEELKKLRNEAEEKSKLSKERYKQLTGNNPGATGNNSSARVNNLGAT